jgi:sugar/nucleoside kinase (ribokinase family)
VLAVLTRGAAGCVVVTAVGSGGGAGRPVDRVVDTTGAGDLFAAGFLYGITNGLSPRTRPDWAASVPPRSSPMWVPGPRPTCGPWPWRPACSAEAASIGASTDGRQLSPMRNIMVLFLYGNKSAG